MMSRIFIMPFHLLFIFIYLPLFSLMARFIWIHFYVQVSSYGYYYVQEGVQEKECSYYFSFLLTYFPQKIIVITDCLRLLFLVFRVFWAHFDWLVWILVGLEKDYFFYWLIRCQFKKRIPFTDRNWIICFIKFLKFSFYFFLNVSDNSVL